MRADIGSPEKFSRRDFMRLCSGSAAWALGAAGLGVLLSPALGRAGEQPVALASFPGLGTLAHKRDALYGVALQSGQLDDHDFTGAVAREASLLVPERELKWQALRPAADRFDFSGYYRIRDFARRYGMALRGHTLVWHDANPDWLATALTSRETAERILTDHITHVLAETSADMTSWDVVNEAVQATSLREDGLRPSPWLAALGPDYIRIAFETARAAAPRLKLVYNDYGVERDDALSARKRNSLLKLLASLRRGNVPVDALGLQSHLHCYLPMAGRAFTDFLGEVRAMGLEVMITELDLDLSKLSGRADDKAKLAQNYLCHSLDLVQKGAPVRTLLTWGLSDRYTWMRDYEADVTGTLPLDRNLARAPFWDSLRTGWLKAS